MFVIGCSLLAPVVRAQVSLDLRPAAPVQLPFTVDSNSAAIWLEGKLHLFSSAGEPMVNTFGPELQFLGTQPVVLNQRVHLPMWIESVWQDPDGTVYAWYHHERVGVCPNSNLNVPEIGALMSLDGGNSFIDLGIILASGEPTDCHSQNGFFANGHGDFSVIADRKAEFVYFLFSAYGGDVSGQGIAIARMPFANLRNPVGAVQKYYLNDWLEPGIGGHVTPIFRAAVGWQEANTDAFWGPSIHWNTYLHRYVVLMNRSCCTPNWPQAGVYITMNQNLADPDGWTEPVQITEYGDWYPWVMGPRDLQPNSVAGRQVRYFIRGASDQEIVFHLDPVDCPVPVGDPASDPAGRHFAIPPPSARNASLP